MCLNYVQGGACLVDGESCLLGAQGNETRNQDQQCSKQGPFDVWRTREDLILISDLGGPHEGVKDCYGLGISLQEATRVARKCAEVLRTRTITTERECRKCGTRFWPRGDIVKGQTPDREAGYFCVSCRNLTTLAELQEYLKQIDKTEDISEIDLSGWCG